MGAGDPVETRLIESLAHPGGNITGISDVATTLTTKRLSLLKELSPKLQKVAMLWNKDDLGMTLRYEASAKVAQSIGVTVQALGVREPDDFNEAFAVMNSDPPDAILMVADALTTLNRKRVFEFAAAKRLPAIYEYDFLVRDGGLMSYGPDLTESFERASALVDRIFKGAKPADLPFEQPTRYLFVINLKTAKAIALPARRPCSPWPTKSSNNPPALRQETTPPVLAKLGRMTISLHSGTTQGRTLPPSPVADAAPGRDRPRPESAPGCSPNTLHCLLRWSALRCCQTGFLRFSSIIANTRRP